MSMDKPTSNVLVARYVPISSRPPLAVAKHHRHDTVHCSFQLPPVLSHKCRHSTLGKGRVPCPFFWLPNPCSCNRKAATLGVLVRTAQAYWGVQDVKSGNQDPSMGSHRRVALAQDTLCWCQSKYKVRGRTTQ